MAQVKQLVKALTAVSHGNVDMREGGIYSMNKGDALELEKRGFVELAASGEPEQTQLDHVPQKKEVGDVVVDDADDLLGDGTKAAKTLDNKAAPATRSKTSK